ncbi:MAG: 4-hydroxy-tetrahydrodipicolinate reductase [Porphyromonas sp.]|nr:4-hydroxy-tetrahydrodipicolinate reductase [Porphyromonas sp.]
MKIALIGYGKMGKTIYEVAEKRGHKIVSIIDEANADDLTNRSSSFFTADVAIEFSTPTTAREHIEACFKAGIPVVCGTTGWLSEWDDVIQTMDQEGGTLFYSSNFSIGVYIFGKINELLATYMNLLPQYNVIVDETHHTEKKDAPSGTALTLAQQILKRIDRKLAIFTTTDGSLAPVNEGLTIRAHRKENVPGIHTVSYSSKIDEITIEHKAHGREGFATGTVMAAEYVLGRKGLFTIDSLMEDLLSKQ